MFWVMLCLVYGILVFGSLLAVLLSFTHGTSPGGAVVGSLLLTIMRVAGLGMGMSHWPKPVRELCERMSHDPRNAGIRGGGVAWLYDVIMSLLACGAEVGLVRLLVGWGWEPKVVERQVFLGVFTAVLMLPLFFPLFCRALLRLIRPSGGS